MKIGDRVRIHAKEQIFEGRLMPSRDSEMVVLKLDSGYNVGLLKSNVTQETVVAPYEEPEADSGKAEHKEGLPTISILHTGGTIASRLDYRTGGVVSSFTPEDLLGLFPELGEIANFDSRLVANMWSDDLRFGNLQMLGQAVADEIAKGVDGVIIGMGTDNMAVASAALSFMLQDLPVPVIFVGSQRSSDRGSSDAAMNLICAARFIAKSDYSGVAICMHATEHDDYCVILPGTKTFKLHSSRRDAFRAVNTSCIARVGFEDSAVDFIRDDYVKVDKEREVKVALDLEDKVGLVKVHVNMHACVLKAFKGFKGLVIEGSGLGHAPTHVPNDEAAANQEIHDAIQELVDGGCVVVMCTQTIFGRVHLHVYSKGIDLADMGVLSGEDMLASTAHVKLAWLLANKPKQAKELIGKNLVGEISTFTEYREDFL